MLSKFLRKPWSQRLECCALHKPSREPYRTFGAVVPFSGVRKGNSTLKLVRIFGVKNGRVERQRRLRGIATMCMAPLARGRMFGRSELAQMAQASASTWGVQRGVNFSGGPSDLCRPTFDVVPCLSSWPYYGSTLKPPVDSRFWSLFPFARVLFSGHDLHLGRLDL